MAPGESYQKQPGGIKITHSPNFVLQLGWSTNPPGSGKAQDGDASCPTPREGRRETQPRKGARRGREHSQAWEHISDLGRTSQLALKFGLKSLTFRFLRLNNNNKSTKTSFVGIYIFTLLTTLLLKSNEASRWRGVSLSPAGDGNRLLGRCTETSSYGATGTDRHRPVQTGTDQVGTQQDNPVSPHWFFDFLFFFFGKLRTNQKTKC